MFVLQIKPEDCSLLGKEILNYIEHNRLSMSEMARQVGMTQPGLRAIVLNGFAGVPTLSASQGGEGKLHAVVTILSSMMLYRRYYG